MRAALSLVHGVEKSALRGTVSGLKTYTRVKNAPCALPRMVEREFAGHAKD